MTGQPSEVRQADAQGQEVDDWWFLGVRVKQLSTNAERIVVSEATLPAGASPPLHIHSALDDCFYVIEGTMVIRRGDEVSLGVPGTWVPIPRLMPHTFRVMGGPARVLLVHGNDSFLRAVHAIGRPATNADKPTTSGGPNREELSRLLAEHDIRTAGPPMEQDEAAGWLQALTRAS